MAEKGKMTGGLQKGLSSLKGFFNRLVGQAKKAKETYEKKGGVKPILSLESRLPLSKLKELVDLMGERLIPPSLTLLKDKMVLEIGEGASKFSRSILEMRPKQFCNVFVGEKERPSLGDIPFLLKGSFKSIPFEDQFFDFVVLRLASPYQGDVISSFKELGRVLILEGQALVLDYHPFGLFSKSGTERLRSIQSTIRGLEDYFKMCKVSGLSIVDLHEGFFDDTLRNQFTTQEEMATFREIKGTPLVLFLRVVKQRKQV